MTVAPPTQLRTFSQSARPYESLVESIPTSSLPPEELLERLSSIDIEWYVTEEGNLFIRYWQLGAQDFIPIERVAEIRARRSSPASADRLEFVSKNLEALRADYAGQWVALTDEGVAASADNIVELMRLVAEQSIEEPFITHIPEEQMIWATAYACR